LWQYYVGKAETTGTTGTTGSTSTGTTRTTGTTGTTSTGTTGPGINGYSVVSLWSESGDNCAGSPGLLSFSETGDCVVIPCSSSRTLGGTIIWSQTSCSTTQPSLSGMITQLNYNAPDCTGPVVSGMGTVPSACVYPLDAQTYEKFSCDPAGVLVSVCDDYDLQCRNYCVNETHSGCENSGQLGILYGGCIITAGIGANLSIPFAFLGSVLLFLSLF